MLGFGGELLYPRSFNKGHVVFIGRSNPVWITLGGFLDHLEKSHWLFLSIDYKRTIENFMTAVLGIDLRKPEHFRICQGSAQLHRDIF